MATETITQDPLQKHIRHPQGTQGTTKSTKGRLRMTTSKPKSLQGSQKSMIPPVFQNSSLRVDIGPPKATLRTHNPIKRRPKIHQGVSQEPSKNHLPTQAPNPRHRQEALSTPAPQEAPRNVQGRPQDSQRAPKGKNHNLVTRSGGMRVND